MSVGGLVFNRMALRQDLGRGVAIVEDVKTNLFYVQKSVYACPHNRRSVTDEIILNEVSVLNIVHTTYRQVTGSSGYAPGIIPLVGTGVDFVGNPVLWTPYLSQNTLRADTAHPTHVVINQLIDAIDAIALVHIAGYDYYDAKDDNLLDMVCRDTNLGYRVHDTNDPSSVVLIDFASPGTRDLRLKKKLGFFGTGTFASPQRLRGLPDPRADVFSVASIGYKILTDSMPYTIPDFNPKMDWMTVRANMIDSEELSSKPAARHHNILATKALAVLVKELNPDSSKRDSLIDFRNSLAEINGKPLTRGFRSR